MRLKFLVAGAAVVVAVSALAFGGVLAEGPASVQGAVPASRPVDRIAALERRVANRPADGRALIELGLAYQARARETADPGDYGRSEEALRRALRAGGDHYLATTGLASVAASRHRFHEALRLAREAIGIEPRAAAAYGILGDALVELGRYRAGFAAFERMAARDSGLETFARISYARELLGRRASAIAAMRTAAASAETSENAAWALVQLGNLQLERNRAAPAESAYRRALIVLPGYAHAEAALARLAAARGEYARAVRGYRAVVARLPLPQYAIALGDTLRAAGRRREAREAYGLVGAIEKLLRANGVRTELETALFDLDHDRRIGLALARAREAYGQAPSIRAEDVLAWALFKSQRCGMARAHSVRALRLGTQDALMFFHRGMIERCLGNAAAGRRYLRDALALNPSFSLLYAPIAREALR